MGVATMCVPTFIQAGGDMALETEDGLQDVGAHIASRKPSHCMEGVATMCVPVFTEAGGDKALETENGLQDAGAQTIWKPSRPQRNESDHCIAPLTEVTLAAPGSNRTSLATLAEIIEEAEKVSDDSYTSDRIADEWAKALDEQWTAAWAAVTPPERRLPDTGVGAPMKRSTEECALGVEACWQPSPSDEGLSRTLPRVRLSPDAMCTPTPGSGCPVLS